MIHRTHWLILCIAIAAPVVIFLSLSLSQTESELLAPLDDTYIHFQYARQFADGDFYRYNPGDDPTSGGSSLLYPIVLAVGYLIGFTGLNLIIWAFVIGVTSHAACVFLIYHLLREDRNVALVLAITFAISGPFVWAALSGMETALFICATLTIFTLYRDEYDRMSLLAAGLAALIRPEGAAVALGLIVAVGLRRRRISPLMLLPLIAIAAQPMLNIILTGSATASGNLAKSHLFNPTLSRWEQVETVTSFGWRIWRELLTGFNPVDGLYIVPLIAVFAFTQILLRLEGDWRARRLSPEVLGLLWMLGFSVAVATLDTAFWHFKRYQLPMLALMFPVGGWLMARIASRGWKWVVLGVVLIGSLYTLIDFAGKYERNVFVVQHQQVAMAEWIDANLPDHARIAVHDVGVMRYLGGRDTYDAVGLTTRDAALAWRSGPGTLYEVMAVHANRPDYFAIYPDVLGLPFFVEAGVMGEELARFEMALPRNTVASATGTQIVTRADFSGLDVAAEPYQPDIVPEGFTLIDRLNVAEMGDEVAHGYHWWNDDPIVGFPTELRRLPYMACEDDPCEVIDGGRVISGGERFRLAPHTDDLLVVLRVHAISSARLTVGCDADQQVRIVPDAPGHWIDIPILLDGEARDFCIESDGIYHPAHYWIYEGDFPASAPQPDALGTFTDPFVTEFTISLVDFSSQIRGDALHLNLDWFTAREIPVDGKLFVHLYVDPTAPPVAAWDGYPGDGTLPPANWLPGARSDAITLTNIPPGEYTLAIGFYDPASGTRYTTQGKDGRLILDTVVVQ